MGGDSVFISGKYINEDSSSTPTNKSIDSDNNTITNIVNADIKSNAENSTVKTILDITDSEINASAAIDAKKIADGSVTSTEFQFMGGLTSDAQTQLGC
ncbi:MAG: hypothetical protein CM15mV141_260 [uncultured marine virus]|nr:MAG: hypothetical protein CM15mV141_260 [uncultured marine virus]